MRSTWHPKRLLRPSARAGGHILQESSPVRTLPRRAGTAIPSLTGIRGVAAFYVCLTHAQIVLATYLNAPSVNQNSFMYNGFRGVDLFFVLSGFILMHTHEDDFVLIGRDAVWRFYVLRFFRVYPLNTLVLLALAPMALCLPGFVTWTRFRHGVPVPYHDHDFSVPGFVQSLFLAQTWSVIKPGQWNGPAWSLSAEVFGYALFPLLAWAASRCRSAGLALLGAALSLLLLTGALAGFGHATDNPTAGFGLVRMAFCFAAGILLQRCFRFWPDGGRRAAMLSVLSSGWILLCLTWRPLNLFAVFGFCSLILALAYRRGPVDAVLASRPAVFLGRISFSFYLIHYMPLQLSLWAYGGRLAASPLWVRVACLLVVAAFCVAAAAALQRWFELPCQRLARRILDRSRSVRAVSAAGPYGRPTARAREVETAVRNVIVSRSGA